MKRNVISVAVAACLLLAGAAPIANGSTVVAPELTGDASGMSSRAVPSPLFAIDRNRATVVERIVTDWSEALANTNTGVDPTQLREMLLAMRADQLLAASLAGTLEGLRNVIAAALVSVRAQDPELERPVLPVEALA